MLKKKFFAEIFRKIVFSANRYCWEQYSAHLLFASITDQISFSADRSTIAKNRILSPQYRYLALVLRFAVKYVLVKIGLHWTVRVGGLLRNRGLRWRKWPFAGLRRKCGLRWQIFEGCNGLVVSYENKRFAISTSGLLYQQTVCCMEKRFALKISGWLWNWWLAMKMEILLKSIGIINVI